MGKDITNMHTTTKFSKLGNSILTFITHTQDYMSLSHDFNLLLSSEMSLLAAELVASGYKPSFIQKERLFSQLKKNIIKQSDFIYKINDIFPHIPEELLNIWILTHFNLDDFKKGNYDVILKDKLSEVSFCQKILDLISDNITTYTIDICSNFKMSYSSLGELKRSDNENSMIQFHNMIYIGIDFIQSAIPQISFKDVLQFKNVVILCKEKLLKKVTKMSKPSNNECILLSNIHYLGLYTTEDLIISITTIIDTEFNVDKQRLLDKVKKNYSLSYFNDTINKDIQHNNTIINNELSKQAIQILEQINTKYFNIKESTDLNYETIQIDILYEKLPDIIKKFILIDKEYREILHNVEGKNAESLMIESLENINTTLDNFIIGLNNDRLSNLSVSQRHIKSIKNNTINR
jgi:hypothetical protein